MLKNNTTGGRNNKRGFTLVELMVTLTLLGFVLALTYQLSTSFMAQYQKVEMRWWVQNATSRVMDYFQQNAEPLSNSSKIDLYYMENLNEVVYQQDDDPDTDLEYKKMQGVPTEGNNTYAYIYSKKDANGNSILYVLDRAKGARPVELTKYVLGMEDDEIYVPLNISFNIATAPIEALTNADGKITYTGGKDKYLESTVDVNVSAGGPLGGGYTLTTSFSLGNMKSNQKINYDGTDLSATADGCSVAGWSADNLTCPVDTNTYPNATKQANILRYVSAQSFLDGTINSGGNIKLEGANLCFSGLSMQGSKFEMQVVQTLRDFRDNVLSKTSLGNKIIDSYYNTVSPSLVAASKEHPSLLKLGKAILIPVSMLTFFISE